MKNEERERSCIRSKERENEKVNKENRERDRTSVFSETLSQKQGEKERKWK